MKQYTLNFKTLNYLDYYNVFNTHENFKLNSDKQNHIFFINVYINQRDAKFLVNSLYFFVKWLYMFRTIISPSSGATFNKLYSAIGIRQYMLIRLAVVWL